MNAPMNRAQRRAAKRQKPTPQRLIGLPSHLDEMSVFSAIERILDKLSTGRVDAANGSPVFLTDEGHWGEIIPALDGWVSAWARIASATGDDLEQSGLRIIIARLRSETIITQNEINQARLDVGKQRRIFRSTSRQRLAELAQTEQIAMYMDEAREAA